MRSSKSRSRSKSNRNRSMGNIVNRVFESSGPEGKVRGTPQQIIDKYTQLARDAQLSNDRVATENFQQHAEHYARLLGEAQREADARREQQETQSRDRPRDRDDARAPEGESYDGRDRPAAEPAEMPAGDTYGDRPAAQAQGGTEHQTRSPTIASDDVLDLGGAQDSGLVETPEDQSQGRPAGPKARDGDASGRPAPDDQATGSQATEGQSSDTGAADERPAGSPSEAAVAKQKAEAKPKPARKPRRPRAPKAARQSDDTESAGGENEAVGSSGDGDGESRTAAE